MKSQTVLIVEDESIVALDLKTQLQKLQYDVVGIAESGERAIELARQLRPSILLMDVRLRGAIDGIEAAQVIRRTQDIPIIFLTSHSDDDTVRRAASTAPYGYLTKPYQIKELRAGVEVALTKAGMERQFREADQWFAHTLQCVADGVILTDLEGRVRFMNPAAEALTGWSLDDAVGREVDEVVRLQGAGHEPPAVPASPPLGLGAMEIIRSVLLHGRPMPVSHAVTLVARGGGNNVVDETAGPINDDGGKRLGAVLILRDAAERVEQEARLRASDERFRDMFDHAPLGMALVSLAGEVIQANEAFCRLLGASADEVKRRGHGSFAIDADRAQETQRLHELMAVPHGVVQFEKRYARLDGGGEVWALVSVSLMREMEVPSCYLYQVHDITEQRKAAEQLADLAAERMKRQASELADASKSEFLSRASHEMRTPLNAVIGFAQLIEHQQELDRARTGTYAHHIREAGEHLLMLVTDLLDLNRAAQGRMKMSPQPLKLADAVGEALHLLETLAQSHGIELDAAIPGELTVLADPLRLRQVLLNLGSNAIKYNRQGGRVGLRAEAAGPQGVRLLIEDTGIGMTAEQLDRLFQPFERLGQERTKIPGVGLGLVITRGLVVEMGGALNVTSEPRAGTTIRIELPAAPSSPACGPQATTQGNE